MSDLSNDLASLRLEEPPARSRRRLWIVLVAALALGSAGLFAWRSTASMRALAVETVQPTIERTGRAAAGTAVLTASGYIVARREAIVSSKIQGRLSELRVEEGSVVRAGELLARPALALRGACGELHAAHDVDQAGRLIAGIHLPLLSRRRLPRPCPMRRRTAR